MNIPIIEVTITDPGAHPEEDFHNKSAERFFCLGLAAGGFIAQPAFICRRKAADPHARWRG